MTLHVVLASGRADAAALADRLREADAEVRRVEPAEVRGALAGADVLAVDARRRTLTPGVVAACDRFGVRIVALCDGVADRRLAEMFGVTAVDAADAVHEILAPRARTVPVPPRGRVIAVWGPHGAPGRTTMAIEVAGELARDGRRVGLVDADTHAPSLAMLAGLPDEGPGFAAACRAAERGALTVAELERISLPLGDVCVLTGINRPGRWPELTATRVDEALRRGRAWVDDLVVDFAAPLERDEEIVSDLDGPRRNAATLAALAAADVVIAVVAADPVGVARFVRAYPDLRATVGAAPIHVVVNKTRSSTLGIDARTQVRRTLARYTGVAECWFIPWDPKAADAAVLQAQPVGRIAPRSALCSAVRRFVGEAIEPPPSARPAAARTRANARADVAVDDSGGRTRTRRAVRGAA